MCTGEILLKDLKKEADKMKTLEPVQSKVMSVFKVENWDEVVGRFGGLVNNDKLLRFTVNQHVVAWPIFIDYFCKFTVNNQ